MEIYIGWNLPPTVKLFLFTSYDFMQRSLNKLTQTSKNRLSISLLFGSWRLRLARVWLTVTCLKEGERVAASLINQIMSILTHYKHSQLQAPTGPSHRNTALRLTSHLWYQSFRGSGRGGGVGGEGKLIILLLWLDNAVAACLPRLSTFYLEEMKDAQERRDWQGNMNISLEGMEGHWLENHLLT